MEKKKRRKLIKRIVLSFLAALFVAIGGVALWLFWDTLFPPRTFDVEGYVLVDGAPVAEFTVNSNLGDAITDENGRFCYEDLKTMIEIELPNDDYYFGSKTYSFVDNASFTAEGKSYKPLVGKVQSGTGAVPYAKITIKAENGTFEVEADENGEFNFPQVVGDVEIVAKNQEGKELFKTNTTAGGEDVVVNAETKATLNVSFDDGLKNPALAQIKITANGETKNLTSGSMEISALEFGDVITISSTEYGFDETEVVIEKENQVIDLTAYKIYQVSGRIQSGISPISNAKVYVDGIETTSTDVQGNFLIENLMKSHTITCEKTGFIGGSGNVDFSNTDINLNFLKKIEGKVNFENVGLYGVKVVAKNSSGIQGETTTDENGKYYLQANIGDTIEFIEDDYVINYLDNEIKEDVSIINAVADKYYDLRITLQNAVVDDSLKVYLNGEEVSYEKDTQNSSVVIVRKLYGKKIIKVESENYKLTIEQSSVTYKNPFISVKTYAFNTVIGEVKSGNKIIESGRVYFDGKFVKDFVDGKFVIEGLDKDGDVTIKADGYDDFTAHVTQTESNVFADMTYSVTVSAKAGDNQIGQFDIFIDGEKISVDGKKTLTGLKGEKEIKFAKEFYSESAETIDKNGDIVFDVSYSITVSLSLQGAPLKDKTVMLIDSKDASIETYVTDENGFIQITDLDSEYTLFVEKGNGIVLKPDYIEISAGGNYYFADSGYNVSGNIKVQGVGVEGVKLVAGDKQTYTDKDGNFVFDLISGDCELVITKEGYTFDKNNVSLTEDNDEDVFEINATYSAFGVVYSGSTPIENANVTLGKFSTITDKDGKWNLSGIDVTGETLVIEKSGYQIDGVSISAPSQISSKAYVVEEFTIKSGDLVVADVIKKVNGKVTDKYQLGDVVTFEKTGWKFENATITEPKTYIINATYDVSGTIKNGDKFIEGAIVLINGEEVLTSANGYFTIMGISGTTKITARFGEFEFSEITVAGPNNEVNIVATYSITVKAICGDSSVEGALVEVAGQKIKTGEDGSVKISSLSGKNFVKISKDGYSFIGLGNVEGTGEYIYDSTYQIKGIVQSAGKVVEGAKVSIGNTFVNTNAKGEFNITGLKGANALTVEKDGFETFSQEIASAVLDLSINLKFSITINFSGASEYSGITVKYGDKTLTTSNNTSLVIPEYFGEAVKLTFSKDSYKFSPGEIIVSSYADCPITITVTKVYTVSGRVTAGGLSVVGLTITDGKGNSTKTDSNGYYTLSGLSGTTTIEGYYDYTTNYNSVGHNCSVRQAGITDTGVQNFTISQTEYAWGLYLNGFSNLDRAESYEMIGGGTVTPTGLGAVAGDQKVNSVKRKDKNGNIVSVNMNYGGGAMGIDPRVALASFYNPETGDVTAYTARGDDVNESLTANYSGTKDNTDANGTYSYSAYQGLTGNYPDKYLPHVINDNTMNSISLSSTSTGYTISFSLKNLSEACASYMKQMTYLSKQEMKSFDKVEAKIIIDKNGYITRIELDESYTVKTASVVTNASLYYDYRMTSIDELKFGTETEIQASTSKNWY